MGRMARRPARTLLEVSVARAGVRQGMAVTKFVTEWVIASQALGGPITLHEFADWWKEPRSTAFRRQAKFRQVFPELETPQPIADLVLADRAEKAASGVSGVGQIPVSAVLA
jgi:hypothetical protein